MANQLLVTLVNSVLGSGKPTARNNYAYYCPFCNHRNKKLEVNLTENKEGQNKWHCWVCHKRGKTIYSLFKQVKANKDKINEASKIIKSSNVSIKDFYYDEVKVNLPKEYKSFKDIKKSDIEGKHALHYLKKRGINLSDILKYNIGYCTQGKYSGSIIIPTYDSDYNLNYFISRRFKDGGRKYNNPIASRNIIANEHLINWDLPIILCEGIFDAIAIKRNVIPLLGTNIQSNLMKRIVTSRVEKVYIALDQDAQKHALKFCEMLLAENKEVYLVDLQEKDPSDMGFENFTKLIQTTPPLDYYELLEKKITL